ncbi:ATP synthase F1 subunit gamma [Puniceicoccales bacterium CK1056]|uniref:ATP synthase gamma chain n=1 Tax=Oceanipulchritudo coccoides TaxID=2706888 RepID=A0A6B2M1C5_9BACT|nr:ATP synthase F1 subunit gamma [Oceanipulchritudo coccoides]NDV62176.1 ATP synthase F1 subunit gamma [Oceanipulchritudo coccoides]
MPNTRDIRNRIRGVKNTQKITRAMQLVAASKMKKAQDRALQGRPYAKQLSRMLASLNGKIEDFNHPFLEEREIKKRGILVISTDRGLCGSLNANLFREITNIERDSAGFITIGRKARQFISRTGRDLLADFPISEEAHFKELRPVVEFLVEQFKEGAIDTIEVLYPRFKNTLVQEPTRIPFLPLASLDEYVEDQAEANHEKLLEDSRELVFEPNPEIILTELLERFVKREIYQMLVDARASEHSARMVAMKAATDNANKLTDSLTLQYNKARQAGITQEILEITAAAQH